MLYDAIWILIWKKGWVDMLKSHIETISLFKNYMGTQFHISVGEKNDNFDSYGGINIYYMVSMCLLDSV